MHKIFRTLDEQIDLLRRRGMIICDESYAKKCLSEYNYYRLSGYSLTLRKNDKFYRGITFEDMMQIYYFDESLRLLLLKYLENIEISLRSHIAYEMGKMDIEENGKICYFRPECFVSNEHCERFKAELLSELNNCRNEAFVKHHNTAYNGILPVWVMVETLSFGSISRLFSYLSTELQKNISKNYYNGLNPKILSNWFEGLVVLRNLCAHHSRLINRGITQAPMFSSESLSYFRENGYQDSQIGKKLFFRIIPLICSSSSPTNLLNQFAGDFSSLCTKYPFVNIEHYAFNKRNWFEVLRHFAEKY